MEGGKTFRRSKGRSPETSLAIIAKFRNLFGESIDVENRFGVTHAVGIWSEALDVEKPLKSLEEKWWPEVLRN